MVNDLGRNAATVKLKVYQVTDNVEQLEAVFNNLQVAQLLCGEFPFPGAPFFSYFFFRKKSALSLIFGNKSVTL